MKTECEVIRDLLPLYTDGACSERSRDLVEEHLRDCPDCRQMLHMLQSTELENGLQVERDAVVESGVKWFRRRTAAVGSAVSGGLMIPIVVCLILNLRSGLKMDWYYLVLAALLVAASLVVVPLIMPEDKAFWTFCAFCASLMILLGVVCLYVHGNWFWIASSAVLFGLSVIFLPFLLRARPVKRWLGDSNRLMIVLGVDIALFLNMMNMISSRGRLTLNRLLFTVVVMVGVTIVILQILKNGKVKR